MSTGKTCRDLLAELPAPPPDRKGWPWTEAPAAPIADGRAWPRISLVTPSFNQAAYLEETIRSVLLQGYPDLEHLVIDGGSTDGSVDIVRKYAPWIHYWVSEPDRGQSHALAKGLARATGTWFNWINSDDYLQPGALAALVTAAEAPGTEAVAVSGRTASLRGTQLFGDYAAHLAPGWPDCLFNLRVNQPGSLLRLSAVQQAGGVREDLHLVMDLDLWLRLLRRHGPAAFRSISAPVAVYRYHEASKTCAGDDVFALEEFAVLADLAASVAGADLSPALRRLRSQCGAARSVPAADGEPIPAAAAERAWVDRLVVTDSLLFRALRRGAERGADPMDDFLAALPELAPALARHHGPHRVKRLQAQALVHALQLIGRWQGRAALRALLLHPAPATVADLIRLILRRP